MWVTVLLPSKFVLGSNSAAISMHSLQPSENQVLCPSTNLHIAYMQAMGPVISSVPKVHHSYVHTSSCPYRKRIVWVEQQIRPRALVNNISHYPLLALLPQTSRASAVSNGIHFFHGLDCISLTIPFAIALARHVSDGFFATSERCSCGRGRGMAC